MSVDKTQSLEPPSAVSFPETRPRTAPNWTRLVIAAAVYFVAGKLGLRFAFLHASTSAIWPASGLAFALLLVWGLRYWPAIFVGAFLVNITTAGSWLNGLLIASGNTLEAVLGTWLVCSFAGGRHAFESARNIVLFWFLACMVATAVAATIGVLSLCTTGAASWDNFRPLWATWWLGDAVGGFLTAVLILLWIEIRLPWTPGRLFEVIVVYALIAGFTFAVFQGLFGNRLFFILPALMWAAFRLGPRETAGALALVSIVTIWGTLRGIGPFITISSTPNEALLRLQSYLAVNAVTTLIVASVVEDARQSALGLRVARDEMEERVIERTALLSTANDALRVEISERRIAEERFRQAQALLIEAERERAENLRAFAASVQRAQEDERLRVSRELHDDLGQRLAALKLSMQMFEQELAGKLPPRTARVETLVGDVDRMMAEVRRLSYNLRPLALDDFGLSVALEMLCKEFEKVYNISIHLRVDRSAGDLHDEQLDIALYRIAQGALSNVAKHSAASNVSIIMTRNDHTVVLSVEDDGRGFDMASLKPRRDIYSGLGLIGMRERSELLGGTLAVASKPDHGTRIQVQIPITGSSYENRPQENTNSDR